MNNTIHANLPRLFFCLMTVVVVCGFFAGDTIGREFEISVNPRGELCINHNAEVKTNRPNGTGKTIFTFGMPARPSDKTWVEDGVLFLRWNEDGIIYTMNLFCALFEDGGDTTGKMSVIVRLHGENTNPEYKEARAGFSILENQTRLPFEFKDGIVTLTKEDRVSNICVIEIPAGCHVVKKNDSFEFSGSMPPGTTGFMVFKIPLKLGSADDGIMSRITNLDYEDCVNIFKKMVKSVGVPVWKTVDNVYYLRIQ